MSDLLVRFRVSVPAHLGPHAGSGGAWDDQPTPPPLAAKRRAERPEHYADIPWQPLERRYKGERFLEYRLGLCGYLFSSILTFDIARCRVDPKMLKLAGTVNLTGRPEWATADAACGILTETLRWSLRMVYGWEEDGPGGHRSYPLRGLKLTVEEVCPRAARCGGMTSAVSTA